MLPVYSKVVVPKKVPSNSSLGGVYLIFYLVSLKTISLNPFTFKANEFKLALTANSLGPYTLYIDLGPS